jgi:hypothetical protein
MRINKEQIVETISLLQSQEQALLHDVAFNRHWQKEVDEDLGRRSEIYEAAEERLNRFLTHRAAVLVMASYGANQTQASITAHSLLDRVAAEIESEVQGRHCEMITAKQVSEASRSNLAKLEHSLELTKREIKALKHVIESL